MKEKELQELAEKYLKGEASETEKQALHQWYDDQFSDDKDHIIVNHQETKEGIRLRMIQQLKQKIQSEGRRNFTSHRIVKWSIAASITIMIIASVLWGKYTSAIEWMVIEVPYGETQSLYLPDSSRVWINAGSILKYPAHFSVEHRKVELVEGEAFFEVTRDEERPFYVSSQDLQIAVLGTSFNVKTYREDPLSKVSVASGLVSVEYEDHHRRKLTAGEEIILDKIDNRLLFQNQSIASMAAWRDDGLIFEKEPISIVIAAIERKYNVVIDIQSADLKSETVSIKLDNQPLVDVLEVLKYIFEIEYSIEDDKNIIMKK